MNNADIKIIISKQDLNGEKGVLLGAAAMIVSGILTQKTALAGIDFNTIGLLVGMMVIVAIAERSDVLLHHPVMDCMGNQLRKGIYQGIFKDERGVRLDYLLHPADYNIYHVWLTGGEETWEKMCIRDRIGVEYQKDYHGEGPVLYAEHVERAKEIKDVVQF